MRMTTGNKKFFYSERNSVRFRLPEKYMQYVVRDAGATLRADVALSAAAGQQRSGTAARPRSGAAGTAVQSPASGRPQRSAASGAQSQASARPQAGLSAAKTAGEKKNGKNTKKPASIVSICIRVFAIIVMIFSVIIIVEKCSEYIRDIRYNNAFNNNFKLSASVNEMLEKRETPVYPELGESSAPRVDYPVVYDQEGLKQLSLAYSDFRCWFYIENTTIQYPVAQTSDNDYYLNHNLDGQESLSGSLFLDFRNDIRSLRGNNIIYGHNMQNGTMFGGLKKYADRDFFFSHQMIYTYTAEEVTAWKVFSAYETTIHNYYIETYFQSDAEYLSFLNKLKADSLFDAGISLTAKDDILTLSTCHGYNLGNDGRFVVHAVKIGSSPLV